MKKIILIIFAVIVALIIFGRFELARLELGRDGITSSRSLPKTVRIGSTTVEVEVADTKEKREKGLSGRDSLEGGHGMLFVFNTEGIYPFWMKNMKFPLDIIWIDSSYRVVGVTSDVRPESYPETFSPNKPAKYVLEVKSGFARENNIKVGSLVSLINIR
ncbi:MAG TPA: DUF192 domain-containing protein [Candidatus Paceibacterota bacterium]